MSLDFDNLDQREVTEEDKEQAGLNLILEMSHLESLTAKATAFYKDGEYAKALDFYSSALKCENLGDETKSILINKKAACFYELGQFDDVVRETSLCLKLSHNNVKALHKRSKAYKAQGHLDLAFEDLAKIKRNGQLRKEWEENFQNLRQQLMTNISPSISLREHGNVKFNSGDNLKALLFYLLALTCVNISTEEMAILYCDRAACFLQTKQYRDCIEEATLCLKYSKTKVKALYRRSQGYEALDFLDEAYKDIINAKKLEPTNKNLDKMLKQIEFKMITKAEIFRNGQGEYGEMDIDLESSNVLWENCQKHPGHPKCIDFKTLTLQDLPAGCQDEGFLQNVKSAGRKTVKLRVRHKSPSRSGPFAALPFFRCGTGYIVDIIDITKQASDKLEFLIKTAAHVVYDLDEVLKTTVEFFYEDRDDMSGVITAEGVRLVNVSIEHDRIYFIARLSRREDNQQVLDKLALENRECLPRKNVTFTVHHPHGVEKKVTFGRLDKVENVSFITDDVISQNYDLLCLIVRDVKVQENKVLFYLEYYNNYNLAIKLPLSKLSPKELTNQILLHLVTKQLVECPSREELEQIHSNKYVKVKEDIYKEMREFVHSQSRYKTGKNLLEGTCDVTSKEEFGQIYREIQREGYYKLVEIVNGKDVADSIEGEVKISYDLETCNGTSGSNIVSYVVEGEGKHLLHEVPHSAGRKGQAGISGGGVVVRLP